MILGHPVLPGHFKLLSASALLFGDCQLYLFIYPIFNEPFNYVTIVILQKKLRNMKVTVKLIVAFGIVSKNLEKKLGNRRSEESKSSKQ